MSKIIQNSREKNIKALRREAKKQKRKYAPKGGTVASQTKRMREAGFYVRKKRKPKVVVIDKTEK